MKPITFRIYAARDEIFGAHAGHGMVGTRTVFKDASGVSHNAVVRDAATVDEGRAISVTLDVPDEAAVPAQIGSDNVSFGAIQ